MNPADLFSPSFDPTAAQPRGMAARTPAAPPMGQAPGASQFDPIFSEVESRYRLPAGTLKALAGQESNYNPNATGVAISTPNSAHAGQRAMGMFQFMPKTWEQYGNGGDPRDPVAAADAAGRLMRDNLQRRGGVLYEALKDYYGRGKAMPGHPTSEQYADQVLGKLNAIRAGMQGAGTPGQYGIDPTGKTLYLGGQAVPLDARNIAATKGVAPSGALPAGARPISAEEYQRLLAMSTTPDASALDFGKAAVGGLARGTGAVLQAGGQLLAQGANTVAGRPVVGEVGNPGDWLSRQMGTDTLSLGGQAALNTTDALRESTLGENTLDALDKASIGGLGLMGTQTFAQMAPVALSAFINPVAPLVVGGAQSFAGANEEARARMSGMAPGELEQLPVYQQYVQQGLTPEQAREMTIGRGATAAGAAAVPAGVGEGVLLRGLPNVNRLTGGIVRRPLRTAAGAALGGLGEGVQEVAEGVSGRAGQNFAVGTDTSLVKGTGGEFVGGVIGGAPFGAAGAVRTPQRPASAPVPEAPAPEAPTPEAPPSSPAAPQGPAMEQVETRPGAAEQAWMQQDLTPAPVGRAAPQPLPGQPAFNTEQQLIDEMVQAKVFNRAQAPKVAPLLIEAARKGPEAVVDFVNSRKSMTDEKIAWVTAKAEELAATAPQQVETALLRPSPQGEVRPPPLPSQPPVTDRMGMQRRAGELFQAFSQAMANEDWDTARRLEAQAQQELGPLYYGDITEPPQPGQMSLFPRDPGQAALTTPMTPRTPEPPAAPTVPALLRRMPAAQKGDGDVDGGPVAGSDGGRRVGGRGVVPTTAERPASRAARVAAGARAQPAADVRTSSGVDVGERNVGADTGGSGVAKASRRGRGARAAVAERANDAVATPQPAAETTPKRSKAAKGAKNAVQEPAATQVDARQQTGNGEAVGEGNTEQRQAPAKGRAAKAETQVAPKPSKAAKGAKREKVSDSKTVSGGNAQAAEAPARSEQDNRQREEAGDVQGVRRKENEGLKSAKQKVRDAETAVEVRLAEMEDAPATKKWRKRMTKAVLAPRNAPELEDGAATEGQSTLESMMLVLNPNTAAGTRRQAIEAIMQSSLFGSGRLAKVSTQFLLDPEVGLSEAEREAAAKKVRWLIDVAEERGAKVRDAKDAYEQQLADESADLADFDPGELAAVKVKVPALVDGEVEMITTDANTAVQDIDEELRAFYELRRECL